MEAMYDPNEVKASFRKRRVHQLLLLLPILFILLVLWYVQMESPLDFELMLPDLVYTCSAILIALVFVASLLNWRCPSCTKNLGLSYNPRYCPKCGIKLR
jgi:hypothetical protein